MWKKTEAHESSSRTAVPVQPSSQAPTRTARIGGSLSVKGDLYGEEDLFIEGRIEGKITLKKGSVTIGEKGRVQADIEATNIQVAGEVEGDLLGREQVVLLETGRVQGNIKAKSVTLENGAQFKGAIDMESAGIGKDRPASGVPTRKTNGSSRDVSSGERI